MNRIYQGKVTKVETKNDKGEWQPLPNWPYALWQHHQLFQDAVNYYTLALAGMAAGLPATHPLRRWREQVHGHWHRATKKAAGWDFPYEAVAKLHGLNCATQQPEELESKFFAQSQTSLEERAAAVAYLVSKVGDDEGKVRDIAGAKLTFLCTPIPDAATDAEQAEQVAERQRIIIAVHSAQPDKLQEVANLVDLKYFITKQPTAYYLREYAIAELKERFKKLTAGTKQKPGRFHDFAPKLSGFENNCAALPANFTMPVVGRKTPAEYNPAAVFRAYPTLETWEMFKTATATLAKKKLKKAGADPIADGRRPDLPYFAYFTNLRLARQPDADAETRSVWYEFDLAAFIEALKSPHRYLQDTKKRDEAVGKLAAKQDAILNGEGASDTSGEADGETPVRFGFKADLRFAVLERMLSEDGDLLVEAETDAETDTSSKPRYTIRERTLRGWRRIREAWLTLAEKGEPARDALKAIVDKEQTEHKDDFGSATLFHVLMKPEYRDLWRDCSLEPWWSEWHADDLLTSWKDYQELLDELKDKRRDIRFTPAHAEYSPRFFTFPKLQSDHRPGLIRGPSRDEMKYETNLVVERERKFCKTPVQVLFTAPRLQRDGLRAEDEHDLSKRPWLQPMLKSLGLQQDLVLQDFANCSVRLQCVKRNGIVQPLLTFPVALDQLSLVRGIYKLREQSHFFRERKRLKQVLPDGGWDYQFVWYGDNEDRQNYYLRWHKELAPSQEKAGYWWEKVTSFSTLSVDLGQRQAGAYALIRVSCEFTAEQLAKSRYIGTTPDGKQWYALVEATGLLRLPGENTETCRHQTRLDVTRGKAPLDRKHDKAFREELYGQRGRTATDTETRQTQILICEFGQPDLLDIEHREASQIAALQASLSFPEQNDKLLVAFRRAQSHASRLYRWCWFLRLDVKKRRRALREIAKARGEDWLKEVVANRKALGLIKTLEASLRRYRESLPNWLVTIANRIYPSERGRLLWNAHPDSPAGKPLCHMLQFAEWDEVVEKKTPYFADLTKPAKAPILPGQRGLSMKRVEQFEELRKRCQSLNQMLRRQIGGEPMKSRDDSIPDPCPTLLDKLENLKEQRCNQTAHFIVAAALGVELSEPELTAKVRGRQDIHGEYHRIELKNKSLRPPVDFIVIEDLSRYRTSQGRAPRENSRLMKWCHSHVRDKLKMLCEPFGLPVVETPAAYSSCFCSRSGVAGFRATELSPAMLQDSRWKWKVRQPAEGKQETEERKFERQRWEQLFAELRRINQGRDGKSKPYRVLIVPETGGELFVPIARLDDAYHRQAQGQPMMRFKQVVIEQERSATPRLIHADMNASVNLGLRAIADPSLWSIHPRLRTERKAAEESGALDQFLTREKRKFGAPEDGGRLEIKFQNAETGYIKTGESKHPNFFADYANLNETHWGAVQVENPPAAVPNPPHLVSGKALWGHVKELKWKHCKEINAARLRAWHSQDNPMPD